MIGFKVEQKRAKHRKAVTMEVSQSGNNKGCSIGKDVQSNLSNRLVVLDSKGQVLSDKVKDLYFQLYERNKLWYE